MTRLGRRHVVLGFLLGLAVIACACGARGAVAAPPASPPTPPPSAPVAPATAPPAVPPLGTPADPAAPLVGRDAGCAVAESGEDITTVALNDPIDPAHAPHPSNDSEQLLFRQVYETLVRVDCHKRIAPGLATSWRLDAGGRTWIVTLRDHASFTDGQPLDATDVRASWLADRAGPDLHPRVGRLVQSIVVMDDRTLAVTLRGPRVDAPWALAHTDLAIARPAAGSPWPLGTRADRATVRQDGSIGPGTSAITVERYRRPPIRFLVASGDPRDLLDKGVDLLVTRDRAALQYAATLPQFRSVPLAWQRTLVLVAPGRDRSAALFPEPSRHAFASDAVRGEAREAIGPFWWETLADCAVPPPRVRDRPVLTPRVIYEIADDAARDVAERLVGLMRATFQRTAALSGEPLLRARLLGNDAGYILALERQPLDPCRDARLLADAAPWLDVQTIVPLVETRLRAIVRTGRAGIVADWDGGMHLAGPDAQR